MESMKFAEWHRMRPRWIRQVNWEFLFAEELLSIRESRKVFSEERKCGQEANSSVEPTQLPPLFLHFGPKWVWIFPQPSGGRKTGDMLWFDYKRKHPNKRQNRKPNNCTRRLCTGNRSILRSGSFFMIFMKFSCTSDSGVQIPRRN